MSKNDEKPKGRNKTNEMLFFFEDDDRHVDEHGEVVPNKDEESKRVKETKPEVEIIKKKPNVDKLFS